MEAIYKLIYIVLIVNTLLLVICCYTLQFGGKYLVIVRNEHTIQLTAEAEKNMFRDTKTAKGESEEMLLSAQINDSVSNMNHSPNVNVSLQGIITGELNTQRSMDMLPCSSMTFEDAVMEQYERFKTFSSRKQLGYKNSDVYPLSKTMQFNFTVQGIQLCNQITNRILQIEETTKNGVKTEGGSGFMVRSYSNYVTDCPVIDHFNGTYSAMCPFYGPCANVSIILKHLQFSGFVGQTRAIERTILKQDNICISPKDLP